MPRKLLVAVIGGNNKPAAAKLAKQFGSQFPPDWILLTGGEPQVGDNVKDAALLGCKEIRGRMVSILPKPNGGRPVGCRKIANERRIELQTGLTNYGRDPITGAAADVVVVFECGATAGTLVELAYAALKKRPTVFLSSRQQLLAAEQEPERKLLKRLTDANEAYGSLIPTTGNDLLAAVRDCLNDQGICEVQSVQDVTDEVKRLSQSIRLDGDTHFLGLPDHPDIKMIFKSLIAELSRLDANEVF